LSRFIFCVRFYSPISISFPTGFFLASILIHPAEVSFIFILGRPFPPLNHALPCGSFNVGPIADLELLGNRLIVFSPPVLVAISLSFSLPPLAPPGTVPPRIGPGTACRSAVMFAFFSGLLWVSDEFKFFGRPCQVPGFFLRDFSLFFVSKITSPLRLVAFLGRWRAVVNVFFPFFWFSLLFPPRLRAPCPLFRCPFTSGCLFSLTGPSCLLGRIVWVSLPWSSSQHRAPPPPPSKLPLSHLSVLYQFP